jgi:hypothetical protein
MVTVLKLQVKLNRHGDVTRTVTVISDWQRARSPWCFVSARLAGGQHEEIPRSWARCQAGDRDRRASAARRAAPTAARRGSGDPQPMPAQRLRFDAEFEQALRITMMASLRAPVSRAAGIADIDRRASGRPARRRHAGQQFTDIR